MNRRVHEIAKDQGLSAKELLAKLKAAGIEVKAASSSVDEDTALRVLGNGGAPKSDGNGTGAAKVPAAPAAAPPPKAAAPSPPPQAEAPTEQSAPSAQQGGAAGPAG